MNGVNFNPMLERSDTQNKSMDLFSLLNEEAYILFPTFVSP